MKISSILVMLFSVQLWAGEEPIMPAEPVAPKGVTLVDSATMKCTSVITDQQKCEFYLIYDGRDDIVYVVKRGTRATDKVFTEGGLTREFVIQEALQSIDLVTVFVEKTSAVNNYSVGFKIVDGVLKVRATMLFTEDQNQVEKLVDVDVYK